MDLFPPGFKKDRISLDRRSRCDILSVRQTKAAIRGEPTRERMRAANRTVGDLALRTCWRCDLQTLICPPELNRAHLSVRASSMPMCPPLGHGARVEPRRRSPLRLFPELIGRAGLHDSAPQRTRASSDISPPACVSTVGSGLRPAHRAAEAAWGTPEPSVGMKIRRGGIQAWTHRS